MSQPTTQEATAWSSVQLHEWTLLGIGAITCLALLFSAGPTHPMTWEAAAASILFGACVLVSRYQQTSVWQRGRMFATYGFALWFFGAIARIIPAWGRVPLDRALYNADVWLFGETPARMWTGSAWLTPLLSGAYLSYLIYLHFALLAYGFGPLERARRAWRYLFVTYSVGFLGYLCVPAVGPQVANPGLFPAPIPGMSHWLSQLNHAIVIRGSGVYDVFPSLHILITCALLHVDWCYKRKRFWLVLPFVLPLFASTLYLRYHYAIDLIAGFAIFALLGSCFHKQLAASLPSLPKRD